MRKILAVLCALFMALSLVACSSGTTEETTTTETNESDNTFIVAMECAYSPYNWTQTDDSNGAVPISGSNEFANGYDIMIAKAIAEANGWDLEVVRTDWDSLVPGVISGLYDATIAGQSMTAARSEVVDFAGPYFYASIVIVTKEDSAFANATGIHDFAGARATAQMETVWYDVCLEQIKDEVDLQTATETAPAMVMALVSGNVDIICTDLPTAQAAVSAYPGLKILNFDGTDNDFVFADEQEKAENVNIGIAIQKGNTELLNSINSVLSGYSVEDFEELMAYSISIAPTEE